MEKRLPFFLPFPSSSSSSSPLVGWLVGWRVVVARRQKCNLVAAFFSLFPSVPLSRLLLFLLSRFPSSNSSFSAIFLLSRHLEKKEKKKMGKERERERRKGVLTCCRATQTMRTKKRKGKGEKSQFQIGRTNAARICCTQEERKSWEGRRENPFLSLRLERGGKLQRKTAFLVTRSHIAVILTRYAHSNYSHS